MHLLTIKDLEQIAHNASQQYWDSGYSIFPSDESCDLDQFISCGPIVSDQLQAHKNAVYISAACPPIIKQLIERYKRVYEALTMAEHFVTDEFNKKAIQETLSLSSLEQPFR